jgi:hypothetical protein
VIAALVAAALVAPAGAGAWTWPAPGPVLQGFAFVEDDPLLPGQHRGIDVAGPLGGQVLAPATGTVTFTGKVAANGLTITIQTPDGYVVTLLHLGSALVGRGANVAEGQPVALVGWSGVPQHPVPYVQLGIRLVTDPQGYLDPQTFLPPLPGATPAEPPAPSSDPQPTPVSPPVAVTPPPAAPAGPLPPAPAALPRTVAPVGSSSDRPSAQPVPGPSAAERSLSAQGSPASVSIAATPETGGVARVAALGLRPVEIELATPRATHETVEPRRPPAPADAWLRPLDAFVAPSRLAPVEAAGAPAPPRLPLLALAAALALAVCLGGRRFGRRLARIIGGDALLPDHTDLLREREPAHRARVHDDRRRRARPAPQTAR